MSDTPDRDIAPIADLYPNSIASAVERSDSAASKARGERRKRLAEAQALVDATEPSNGLERLLKALAIVQLELVWATEDQ